jgi:PAS domain S-box-containing protein
LSAEVKSSPPTVPPCGDGICNLLRSPDWPDGPLGPSCSWPQSLRTALSICLGSPQPALLAWGGDLALLYNDAFAAWLDGLHPHALGRPIRDAWPAAEELLSGVLTRGRSAAGVAPPPDGEGRHVELTCSAVRDESGVGGVFALLGFGPLERYRPLAQHVHDVVLFFRPDGRILDGNDAAAAVYGYSREELRALTAFDLRDPSLMDDVPAQLVLADRDGITFQTRHRRKDGSTFPVEVSSRGDVVAGERILVSIIRDVTDRLRVEEELRKSEARYRDLFENANDVIYTLDLAGRITSVNRRAELTFGYRLEECVGRDAGEMVPAEFHPRMREALRRKLAGEASPTTYELEVISRDGRRVPLEISSRLIVSDGAPVGIQGIARDVSERRRAGAALRESEERLRLALDAGRCGVWDWDVAADRLTCSDRIYEFAGLPPGAYSQIGDFVLRVHPDDAGRIREDIRKALEQEGAPYSHEYRIVRPTGEVRWLSANGRVIRDESGRAVRMLGATIDVTERRAAEEALRQASARKDDFLAMLAHELRNPLGPIRTAVEILEMTGAPNEVSATARSMIARQATHLARLVDDLLDVSRLSRDKVLLRTRRLDLAALLRGVAEDYRPALRAAGLRFEVELPDAPVWVEGDPTRLAQIAGNLLHNAGKFTEAGGRVVLRLESSGGEAVLGVADSGVGVERETLGRLFEPFVQADRSLDRSRGGLGLGLALVSGLTALHGGRVDAASDGPGRGSTFTVRLPLAAQGAVEAEEPPARRPAARRRVLVIEDNFDAAQSLRMLLELWGHEVTVAHSGPAGVEESARLRPDVVLCDVGLPGGMDGHDVARALRASPPCPVLIALTGYGQEQDRRRALDAGFDRHLTKPVEPEVIAGLLGELGEG